MRRFDGHPVFFVLGAAALLAAACSNSSAAHDAGGGQRSGGSSDSSSDTQSGAGSGGGASQGGSAGSAGGASTGQDAGSGSTANAEATRVCRAAIMAQVERENFCFGYDIAYGKAVDACPDYYFNADSNRNVADVEACLPQLAKTPCSELALNVTAECLVGGKRPSGAGCSFSSQCQSDFCAGGDNGCGTCRDGNFAPGATCERFECRPGDTCDETANKCISRSTFVYAAEGEHCRNSKTSMVLCQGDLQCNNLNGMMETTCQKLVVPSCGDGRCDTGWYCRDKNCAPAAKLGEACGEPYYSDLPPCLANLRCWKGKCVQRRASGESCDDAQPCSEFLDCVKGTCQLRDCSSPK